MSFLIAILDAYDSLISKTLLHTVLPYISLDILVQRYISSRNKARDEGADFKPDEAPSAPEPTPIGSNSTNNASPDASSDELALRFHSWLRAAASWLGLEKS